MSGLPRSLRDHPQLLAGLRELSATDDWRNLLYIGRAWLVAIAAAGAAALRLETSPPGVDAVDALSALAALFVVGAAQHQLGGAVHEATHRTLFRHRVWNEVAADWLCAFPLLTATHLFRQHHLEHHRWVNDARADPNVVLLRASGHWPEFPATPLGLVLLLARQLLLLPLLRYDVLRARVDSLGVAANGASGRPRLAAALGAALLGVVVLLHLLLAPLPAGAASLGAWLVLAIVYRRLPRRAFAAARHPPSVSVRTASAARTLFLTAAVIAVAAADRAWAAPVTGYVLLFWVAPLLTVFPLLMVSREVLQHGNAGGEWLGNSRTFRVGPLVRWAVFPFGMEYHLAHHLFAGVPHHRLARLHALLANLPGYGEGRVVEGVVLPRRRGEARPPTAVEALTVPASPVSREVEAVVDTVAEPGGTNVAPVAAPGPARPAAAARTASIV